MEADRYGDRIGAPGRVPWTADRRERKRFCEICNPLASRDAFGTAFSLALANASGRLSGARVPAAIGNGARGPRRSSSITRQEVERRANRASRPLV